MSEVCVGLFLIKKKKKEKKRKEKSQTWSVILSHSWREEEST